MNKIDLMNAIDTLKELKQAAFDDIKASGVSSNDPAFADKRLVISDYNRALDALNEQLRRLDGCPVCHGTDHLWHHQKEGYTDRMASFVAVSGDVLEIHLWDYGDVFVDVKIAYCPRCGREIKGRKA